MSCHHMPLHIYVAVTHRELHEPATKTRIRSANSVATPHPHGRDLEFVGGVDLSRLLGRL